MVSLLLRMCKLIFGTVNDMVLESGFCVVKGNTELEARYFYVKALIKKRRLFLKGFIGDLIDNNFQYKEVGDAGMIEARTQDNNTFKIFSMK